MNNSSVYLVRLYNDNESFLKIGTTVNKFARFYQLMKFGYRANIIYMVRNLDMTVAYNLEYLLKMYFNEFQYIPKAKFGGYTECFQNIDVNIYKEIVNNNICLDNKLIENLEITWR